MADASSRQQVGVVIVKRGCCGGEAAGAAAAKARSLMERLGASRGISLAIRELEVGQAMQGGLPPSLLAQAMEAYRRLGIGMIPAILINGKWVSFGDPQEYVLQKALQEASCALPARQGSCHER